MIFGKKIKELREEHSAIAHGAVPMCENQQKLPEMFSLRKSKKNGSNLHKHCKILFISCLSYVCIKIMT